VAVKKRMGRPTKPPKGNQAQLTILVRADIKRALVAAAQKHGRTLSTEAVMWFEELDTYRQTFKRMQQTAEEVERIGFAAAAERKGFNRVRTVDAAGKVHEQLFSPGHPYAPGRSGFIPPDEGDPRGIEIRDLPDGSTEIVTRDGSDEEPKT
jgi:hypothetical protein